MKEITLLAFEHLDACMSAGQMDKNTCAAIAHITIEFSEILDQLEKKKYQFELHHNYYKCVPRTVSEAKISDLQIRLNTMTEAISRYLEGRSKTALTVALERELKCQ